MVARVVKHELFEQVKRRHDGGVVDVHELERFQIGVAKEKDAIDGRAHVQRHIQRELHAYNVKHSEMTSVFKQSFLNFLSKNARLIGAIV